MRVLAIDTALEACSTAMLDTAHADVAAYESLPMARGHAEALIPLIARVMHRAGLTFAELDRIAVTTGPGSFTGLRVGISAARGIGLAAAKPVVGLAGERKAAEPGRAAPGTRHRLGRPARRGGGGDKFAAETALPARARCSAAGRRAIGAPMIGFISNLFARGEPMLTEASARDSAAIA